MKHRRKVAVAAVTALLFPLAACGSDNDESAAAAKHTAPNGDVFNEADLYFATAMIPHHAEALVMVDLTRGRDLSPEVRALTDQIRAAQTPEIEEMVDWLTAWDEPVPPTIRDHVNAEDHSMSGHGMEGTDADDLADLEHAHDRDFEDMWLQMMIAHHEGAIEMAQDEQEDGLFSPAVKLAESIESSQQREVELMEELLGS